METMDQAPAITEEEQTDHITKALAAFLHHHPFFPTVLSELGKLRITKDIPTAATDGYNVMINPEWAAKQSHENLVFVFAHEIMHIVYTHCPRFKAYVDRGWVVDDLPARHDVLNIAADCIINQMLIDDRVGEMPKEGCLHDHITGEHSLEQAYKIVWKDNEKEDGNGGGKGGQGFDDHFAPSNIPGQEPKPEGAVQRAVQTAAATAKAIGKMSSGLERLIGELMDPTLPWTELLQQYLSRMVSGRDTRTWKRPNRRRLVMLNQITPAAVSQQLDRIVFCTDLSGSMSDVELRYYFSEIAGVMEQVAFEEAHCVWFEASVSGVDTFEDAEDFRHMVETKPPRGGGGTNFVPCFEWVAEELQDQVDVMIFLTDGYGPSPAEPPPYDVIVLTSGQELPFGYNIKVEPGA